MPTFRRSPSLFVAASARAALLLLLAATPVAAQSDGTIRGTVADVFGSALPGVRVTATGPGVDAEDLTDVAGAFEFTGLPSGNITVTATFLATRRGCCL